MFQADYLQLVPPVAIELIKSGRSAKVNISSVKSIYSAAAPLGKEVETQLAALFKLKSISQSELSFKGYYQNFSLVNKHFNLNGNHMLTGIDSLTS